VHAVFEAKEAFEVLEARDVIRSVDVIDTTEVFRTTYILKSNNLVARITRFICFAKQRTRSSWPQVGDSWQISRFQMT
jgi:hypothetical protein